LGSVLAEALGDKRGVRRFASVRVPLDEALVDVALDLSGRPFLYYDVEFPGEKILGDPPFDPQLVEEFWRALVTSAGITLHISLVRGRNTHHIIESCFKSVARALRDAVRVEGGGVPSTKGTL
jgi:imidazoleglycerol-phosphate dehydratase